MGSSFKDISSSDIKNVGSTTNFVVNINSRF